ncbi:ATP-binding protein [Streptomyces rubiginosohelvolus]|uniref:ATP-binding protein n=1 Tax=Streptomyces rubiginosohelvolus TaxID=67362 RepID=UPI0034355232
MAATPSTAETTLSVQASKQSAEPAPERFPLVGPPAYLGFGLPHQPEAAIIARRQAYGALARWGVGGASAHDVVLVLSELVANAAEHALPYIYVSMGFRTQGGARSVLIEVEDGGPRKRTPDRSPPVPAAGEHGRGLVIVGALASASGVECRATHQLRWAEVATP